MKEARISSMSVGLVVIGRNEGERLKRCLQSIPDWLPTVYVDSGSTDDSVRFATSRQVSVVELDMQTSFTAARARNVGWRHLVGQMPNIQFVQFIDGDCEMDAGWLDSAFLSMQSEPQLAAVFGRRRERFPEASVYNKLCDDEWNVPPGIVGSCGGDAFFRMESLKAVGGYSDDLIAGEEPDLCLRLRRVGWRIRRIDAEMTLHDANILTFGSWWTRTKRGGYAYTQHVLRHGSRSDPHRRRQVLSICFWGFVMPIIIAILSAINIFNTGIIILDIAAMTLFLAYIFQIMRWSFRKRGSGASWNFAFRHSILMMLGKFAEFSGLMKCLFDILFSRRATLIEYKGADAERAS